MSAKNFKNKVCGGCREKLSKTEFLKCSLCSLNYDLICAGLSVALYNSMTIPERNGWECIECLSKRPKSDNQNTPVRSLLRANNIPTDHRHDESPEISYVNTMRLKQSKTTSLTTSPIPSSGGCDCVSEEKLRAIIKQEVTSILHMAIDRQVTDRLKSIQSDLLAVQDSISFVNREYEDLKKQIDEKSSVITKLEADSSVMSSTIGELSRRLAVAEQHLRESNIEINGIPEHRSENVCSVAKQLANTVGYCLEDCDIIHATRVAKLSNENNRPRPVVVKLKSPRLRDSLLAAVAEFNRKNPEDKLSSRHLGIAGSRVPIYVAEHLTPANKALHAAARIKGKEKKYKFIWVRNGRIFVRKDDKCQAIQIRNNESLKFIV
ncbi:unnamed protein product [Euphydryas editha]|uniref:FP protein C-terminal domain-containing protein n=1 Tax=Euphydryas editha TaxID=104508 RepID=A0AAU9TKX8_EUPED|nr:unnamed protein product [Euphydryas editha]